MDRALSLGQARGRELGSGLQDMTCLLLLEATRTFKREIRDQYSSANMQERLR